ncbi:ribosomal protein S18-alanine N-acetyltransferase [Lacticaseibacillus jixianensis]|uniref:Ribosomal protein S18-alanine N-acetyltransferase n=1 Tax=Lacticaseibacillus jixianensis TaxID=2486012 RepID=A0ABW4BAN1_9LACO|nr:ribosomal protein S18-alanine N-acetyltransferase [Lacticaseibacillus jixianensis]
MFRKFKQWLDNEPPEALAFPPQTLRIGDQGFQLRRMHNDDIDAALDLEKAIYHDTPWDRLAFLSELRKTQRSLYLVLFAEAQMVAFIGCWFGKDEAHITNIAVTPAYQGRGIGEALMKLMIAKAEDLGPREITLEVRTDNLVAQHLYHKLGFQDGEIRRGYYVSTHGDAMDMRKSLV